MTLRNFWSQLFPAWSFRTAPHERRFRLHLEHLEDRTLPSVSVFFDSAAGNLSLLGDGSDDTIRQTLSSAGFLEVAVDGHQHSSDPKSAFFDQALAGANAGNLAGIHFDGGGRDTLILGAEQLAGNLTVSADGVVRTQDVTVGGRLVIQAPTVSVGGNLRGGDVTLDAAGFVTVEAGGLLTANQIDVSADVFVNSGQLGAAPTGGEVLVSAGDVLNSGRVSADGSAGGGAVRISFTRSYVDTSPSVISADGGASPGGSMTIDGGATGRLFISGRHESVGSVGGSIDLFGQVIELVGATVDASGDFGGGSIRIGGQPVGQVSNLPYRGWQVENLPHNAETVTVTGSTTVRADALGTGDGGRVVVWSDQDTHFDSSLSARGGPASGAGGFIEVSSKGTLTYRGGADAGAPGGKAGTLLLDPKNLIISAAPAGIYPQFDLVDPHPTAGGGFGTTLAVLTNGNVVVTNPNDDFGGTNAGAVYLFDGLTGALLSSLVGGNANDRVGNSGVTVLNNGNYLVQSPSWNGNRGAVTWGSGTTGISGTLSDTNSLVGGNVNDRVGNSGVTVLNNGNYLVQSPSWNGNRGAVTWGSGATGISGILSDTNSLVGSNVNDPVGNGGIIFLSNGNYLVKSPSWNGNRGALTWGSGTSGISGILSDANSLVGGNVNDQVGNLGITTLSNGNYLVQSSVWNSNRGALTWGSGTAGVSGTVSDANSLVGSNDNDRVGSFDQMGSSGVTILSNGNYVVRSPFWNGNRGAVTWGSGTVGVSGAVSDANSLDGSNANDRVGNVAPTILSNDNYLVRSTVWNGNRGAVTWGSGTTGISGVVSDTNSLVGSNPNDQVGNGFFTFLSNGNYLVRSPNWNGNRGAVTWGSSTTGVSGIVSDGNSLVGSNDNDQVGNFGITALNNGNYVVQSPFWNGNRGAATWGSGATGIDGIVSGSNSLVGSNDNDQVGNFGIDLLTNGCYLVVSTVWNGNRGAVTRGSSTTGITGMVSDANSLVGGYANDQVGAVGIIPLPDGGYFVRSPHWNGNRGAVTWGSGTTGISSIVSDANSLVGSNVDDQVGNIGIRILSNGNYLVISPNWNGNRGAVTWRSATTGIGGIVSDVNSLVGSNANDQVGNFGITTLSNGNYLVRSLNWHQARGAVTWGSGTTGISGIVSDANSLVGSSTNDFVGFYSITSLSNGNYVIQSPYWNGNRGAVTWGSGTAGISGIVSDVNSLVGSNVNDEVGNFVINTLSNGNYLVRTPNWNGNRGAVTWGSATTGISGIVSDANSLIGTNVNDQVGNSGITFLSNSNFLVNSPNWNGNRGAVTWGSGTMGISGLVSEANSLVGSNANDRVDNVAITPLSNGNYLVRSSNWNGNRGAVTWGSSTTGVSGIVSDANSLVGSNASDFVGDSITWLSNGNYVVNSPNWNGNRGAVTWGSSANGVSGIVSDVNSLVGSNPDDQVGNEFVSSLSNGIYLVPSPNWNGNRGAVTWVSGTTGQTLDGMGFITPQNSLVGRAANAGLGAFVFGPNDQTFLVAFTSEGGGRVTVGLLDPNQLTYAGTQAQTITITPEFLTSTLNTGTAVRLQASNDITVNSPITVSAGGNGGALTLQAGRSIRINANISTDNGDLSLIANDQLASGVVDSQRDPGLAVIMMASGTTLDTGSGTLTIELRDGAGLTNSDSGAITLQTLTAGSLSVANNGPSTGSDVILGPVTTAGAQSYANPNGTTRATANLTAGGNAVTFNNSVALAAGLTLGSGSDSFTFAGGTVAPDPGLVTFAGSLALSGAATFTATLNGTDPASYSQVVAGGPLDLGGSTLTLALGFTPQVGDSFTLLTTSDGSPIIGTFAGLDEGATFTLGGVTFQITYQGGPDGNSVVLTCVA